MSHEGAEAWILGTAGLVKGLYEEVKPNTAGKAWAWMFGAITAYELTCPKGELLSEGVDRAIDKHPIAVPLAIGYTALHLANRLPESIDVFHRGSELLK